MISDVWSVRVGHLETLSQCAPKLHLKVPHVVSQGARVRGRGDRGTMDTYFSFCICFKYLCGLLTYYRPMGSAGLYKCLTGIQYLHSCGMLLKNQF